MKIPKDIEATIYFLTPVEGGRSSAAWQNYRPQFNYDGRDWVASVCFPDKESAMPGESVRTHIGFMSPKEHVGKIEVGTEFIIREGNRTVGRGEVTKILDLLNSASHGE